MNNEELREGLSRNNALFNFPDFFGKSSSIYEGAAISVITSKQIITTMTQNDGEGSHIEMLDKIVQAVYDLPAMDSSGEDIYEEYISDIIIVRIWFVDGEKYVIFEFPDMITQGQITMLEFYKRIYGEEIDKVSEIYCYEALEEISDKRSERVKCFDDIVLYCRNKTIRKEKNKKEYVIGFTEQRLLTVIKEKLKKGITMAMCGTEVIGANRENEGIYR